MYPRTRGELEVKLELGLALALECKLGLKLGLLLVPVVIERTHTCIAEATVLDAWCD